MIDPRIRQNLILAIAAAAVLAAAWFLLDRAAVRQPPSPGGTTKAFPAPATTAAPLKRPRTGAPASIAPGPAPVSANPTSAARVSTPPSTAAPPVASAEATAPPSVAAPELPTEDAAAPSAANANATTETDSDTDSEADSEAAPATEPTRDDASDRTRAVELFAEYIAELEPADGSEAGDTTAAASLHQFRARAEGSELAGNVAAALREHLSDWLAAFPAERAAHVLLVSVECRIGACQILMAENPVDFSGKPEASGQPASGNLEHSFLALRDEDWWKQLKLELAGIRMSPAGYDLAHTPGYALWTIYVNFAPSE
jgi:hypothetical protein